MSTLLKKVTKPVRLLLAFFPSALPVGMSHFHVWADDIIELYGLEKHAANDSLKFSLATMIMHSGPTDAFKSKFSFLLKLKSAMAKQIAGAHFTEIKLKQKAEQDALAAKAALDAASNENKQ